MSKGELACTYAALILHDEGIPVTAEKISALVKAANVPVESYFPGLFAKLCEKRDINDLILINSAGSGVGAFAAAVAAPAADAPTAAAPESAAEASKEESDDDMNMFDLFG